MSFTTIQSEDQFQRVTKEDKYALLMFSAPWCGSCRMVFPQVQKLVNKLDNVELCKLSAEDLEDLYMDLNITSYPHFRVYRAGELLGEYTGSKLDKIEDFVTKLTQTEAAATTETN